MERMKQMVFEYESDGTTDRIEIDSRGIRRTKEHDIVTRTVKKTFAVTANKRKLGENFVTFPYGYQF